MFDLLKETYFALSEEEMKKTFNLRTPLGGNRVANLFSKTEHSMDEVSLQDGIEELYQFNHIYVKKFGFRCILACAGMTPKEQYNIVKNRYDKNTVSQELLANASELHKIDVMRLKSVVSFSDPYFLPVPDVSTHGLDLATGTPCADLEISIYKFVNGSFRWICTSTTDKNGRIAKWKDGELEIPVLKVKDSQQGQYRLDFDTGKYFAGLKQDTIYPFIRIEVNLDESKHYHIPILLSPYGYSTYKGQ
jgi:hydroxyisourate hydrolase